MLEKTAIQSMLDAGATYADVARQMNVSLAEAQSHCEVYKLTERSLMHFGHLRRLTAGQHIDGAKRWELLLADDFDGRVINGIDTLKTDGRIAAQEIISHYHGECRCYYSNEPTDQVMAADGDAQNLLISNLVPIAQSVLDERFRDTCITTVVASFGYSQFTVRLTVQHRLDKLLGSGFNTALVTSAMGQWIEPYAEQFTPQQILEAYELPGTPDLLALWVWRQLEKVALLKGMSEVTVLTPGHDSLEATVTKQQILHYTRQMLARQFGQRSVLTSQPAVMPPQGHGPVPGNLIKL